MMEITTKLHKILTSVRVAEKKFNRIPNSVRILAVSKGQTVETIKAAIKAGQYCFGENYIQEAIPKIQALADYPIEWHFIGKIQSNKTKLIAENFAWVHSVDQVKVAILLNKYRPLKLPPLNICIQVKPLENEDNSNRAGILASDLLFFAESLLGKTSTVKTLNTQLNQTESSTIQLNRLHLRGLMTILNSSSNFKKQFNNFQQIQNLAQQLIDTGIYLDTLSMGMTNDLEAAIAAGSTIVRIGTGIFGTRNLSDIK